MKGGGKLRPSTEAVSNKDPTILAGDQPNKGMEGDGESSTLVVDHGPTRSKVGQDNYTRSHLLTRRPASMEGKKLKPDVQDGRRVKTSAEVSLYCIIG